ncbi:lytic transglycosylase domain-containing protein [Flavobacteriaceae bacterium]|nr:lytic transglycosylase domain-containing protein [Flavobacteriaceae bacterium]
MHYFKTVFFSIGTISFIGFIVLAFTSHPNFENKKNSTVNDYNVYALEIPTALDFSGEVLPVFTPDIRERMDRELLVNTYWQSNGLLLFKRSHRYFPVIEPILKSYGIPDDFKYLALIESGLQNVTSPAGAKGFWQIMEATGKEYGLEINSNVDERYNLELSTHVACNYILKAKEKFGDWTLAAAAYNAGIRGISNQLEKQQVTNYYDLLLGEETGRYIFRIVALKEILNHPKKYGFNFTESDLYAPIPTSKIQLDTAVTDFVEFARKLGLNYKQLKIHNPWLREGFLNNKSRKLYTLEIPDKGYYDRVN